MRARWPRGLVALLLAASAGAIGAAALMAGPAQAAPAAAVCGQPLQPLCSPKLSNASGSFTETGGTITVTWVASGPGTTVKNPPVPTLQWVQQASVPSNAPPPPTINSVPLAEAQPCVPQPGTPPGLTCTYQWPSDLLSNGYVLNGTYTLSGSAQDCSLLPPCSPATSLMKTVDMANPPVAPTGVKAAQGATPSTVNISWAANPEPDVSGYEVFRSDGTFACQVVTTLHGPSTYSCPDSPPKDGQYSYHVVAYRWGATYSTDIKGQAAGAASATSDPVTVNGTSANTSTTVPGGGAGATLAPSGFTAKPSPSKAAKAGGTGIGTFSATPGTVAAPVTTDPVDNGGFAATLPYGQRPAPPNSTDPAAIATPAIPHKGTSSVATVAAVGASLLVAVIALHGLWLRSEVRRSGTLEAIEPEV